VSDPELTDHRAATHEPHGHCAVCHTGVHRYRGDSGGVGPWQHVNIPSTAAHEPVPVPTCCPEHGARR
jgi:hypothetical protein